MIPLLPLVGIARSKVISVFHKTWACPKQLGLEIATNDIAKAAVEAGDKSWLFSKGVLPPQVSVDSGVVPMVAHKSSLWARFEPHDGLFCIRGRVLKATPPIRGQRGPLSRSINMETKSRPYGV